MRAFSLLETIASVGLLSLVVILVLDLYPQAMLTLRSAEQHFLASTLARSLLEEQCSRPFGALTVPSSQTLAPIQQEGVTFTPTLEVYPVAGTDPQYLKGLRVRLDWTYRGRSRSFSMECSLDCLNLGQGSSLPPPSVSPG